MAELVRLSAEALYPAKDLVYVDTHGLLSLYDKIAFKSNLILVGPKGVGKSLSYSFWSGKRPCPAVILDCSEETRRSTMIGVFTLAGDVSPFMLGALTTAYELANEVGEAVLCLEEINALTPQAQKMLNPVTDFRKSVQVTEVSQRFQLNAGSKLWVVGTMNTLVYGGVYALNEDLKSRFRLLNLGYPSSEQERAIVSEVVKNLPDDTTVTNVLTLAEETRQPRAFEYALSTRDVVQILEDIPLVGLEYALRFVEGKFEGNDRETFRLRAQSIFE